MNVNTEMEMQNGEEEEEAGEGIDNEIEIENRNEDAAAAVNDDGEEEAEAEAEEDGNDSEEYQNLNALLNGDGAGGWIFDAAGNEVDNDQNFDNDNREAEVFDFDLNQVIEHHPYLQARYPDLLPLTLRELRTLERAQEILMMHPNHEDYIWRKRGQIDRLPCDGRRIGDDIAILNKLTVLDVIGPGSTTIPSTVSRRNMPDLATLVLQDVPEDFNIPRQTAKELPFGEVYLENSSGCLIRQFYHSSISKVDIRERSENFTELISTLQHDADIISGMPMSRRLEVVSVVTYPITVDQFCDFVLLFTPDKYPSLTALEIVHGDRRTDMGERVNTGHIEELVKRLNILIKNNKTFVPPRLKELMLPSGSTVFSTSFGLRNLISLLDIFDGVIDIGTLWRTLAWNVECEQLNRHVIFRLNYTRQGFSNVSPVAKKLVANGQQPGKDRDRGIPLSLWPHIIHRAHSCKPYYNMTGGWFLDSNPSTQAELPQWHASSIFVLLKNGLAGEIH